MSPGTQTNNIDSILTENRVFECSDEFRSKAHIRGMDEYERLYQAAETDPETDPGVAPIIIRARDIDVHGGERLRPLPGTIGVVDGGHATLRQREIA